MVNHLFVDLVGLVRNGRFYMGVLYSSFEMREGEDLVHYEKRISDMLPFVSGMAYFDLRNYDPHTGEFHAYVEWEASVNDSLAYRLPSGGYHVKATIKQAYELHSLSCGVPVYMKLVVNQGKLYSYRTYIIFLGRFFSLEFGGGPLIPFEERYEELGCVAVPSGVENSVDAVSGSQRASGSQRYIRLGSQRFIWTGSGLRYFTGSGIRVLTGSGMRYFAGIGLGYLTGSGIYGGYLGSQRHYRGSWRHEYEYEYGLGSQRYIRFGSQRFVWTGSGLRYYTGSGIRYLTGSGMRYFTGSGMRYFTGVGLGYLAGSGVYGGNLGSQRLYRGSWRHEYEHEYEYGLVGSQRYLTFDVRYLPEYTGDEGDYAKMGNSPIWGFPNSWQLINRKQRPVNKIGGNDRFGYGLDLV